MLLNNYPSIKAAAVNIAYDNGMVYRSMTEGLVLEQMEKGLSDIKADDLDSINQFLSGLIEDELYTVCCSEDEEAKAIMNRYYNPQLLDNVLNTIFDS